MERVTEKQYWMDGYLKDNLNSLAYNMKHDFDSLICISGSGLVRVGKSVLAQQIGYFMAYRLGTTMNLDNIVFSGAELISIAKILPKNSVIIYDEARGELDTKKVMENITKNLLDFFAECGMYNHCLIMVLPDYFELPKSVAINRSECLINVIRTTGTTNDSDGNEVVKFERGVFEFYNRNGKKMLYILGKKNYDDYSIGKKYRSFFGEFPNVFVMDKKEYEDKKLKHIQRTRIKNRDELKLSIALHILSDYLSQQKMADQFKERGMPFTQARMSQIMKVYTDLSKEIALHKS